MAAFSVVAAVALACLVAAVLAAVLVALAGGSVSSRGRPPSGTPPAARAERPRSAQWRHVFAAAGDLEVCAVRPDGSLVLQDGGGHTVVRMPTGKTVASDALPHAFVGGAGGTTTRHLRLPSGDSDGLHYTLDVDGNIVDVSPEPFVHVDHRVARGASGRWWTCDRDGWRPLAVDAPPQGCDTLALSADGTAGLACDGRAGRVYTLDHAGRWSLDERVDGVACFAEHGDAELAAVDARGTLYMVSAAAAGGARRVAELGADHAAAAADHDLALHTSGDALLTVCPPAARVYDAKTGELRATTFMGDGHAARLSAWDGVRLLALRRDAAGVVDELEVAAA